MLIRQVDGKNAATGESARMINDVESDDHGTRAQRDPQRADGFNPNDAGGRGTGGEKGTTSAEAGSYTDTKPAEVASESHSLPGPKSVGAGQTSKGHNPTQ